jgi:translocation and assembly module TamB
LKRFWILLGLLFLWAVAGVAQDEANPEEDDGFLVNLLQNRLSAPGRQIRLHGISGVLSSQASIEAITVSDAEGEWLRIEDVELDWNRLALLRGGVSINALSAGSVDVLRRPEPPVRQARVPELPQPEARPFTVPELPVAVRAQELRIDRLSFAEPVFGQAAELRLEGSLELVSGALDTALDVRRLDDPGGELTLDASFSNETRQVAIDLALREPANGIVATLLNIEGRPPIELTVAGSGPIEDLTVALTLDAAGDRLAEGTVELRERDAGLGFTANLSGELAPLVPPAYRDFFAGTGEIRVDGVSKREGGVRIDELSVAAPVLTLQGSLETGPDFFPQSINLSGSLGDPRADPLVLPVPGGETTINSATLHVAFGGSRRWTGIAALDRLRTGDILIEDLTLDMGGLAENLAEPAERNVTLHLVGLATGVSADDPATARALGSRIDLFADAAFPPDAPARIRQFQLSGNGLSIFTAGTLENLVYAGRNSIRADSIAPFSDLAGRELGGALDLEADGSMALNSGGFDLALDGTARDLELGDPRLDRLLEGETELSGRVVRNEEGFRTDGFRLANPQLEVVSDGRYSSGQTDIGFEARITELAALDPRVTGALTATGTARGSGGPVTVDLSAGIPDGSLLDRPLSADLGFRGTIEGQRLDGSVDGRGRFGDAPLSVAGDIAVDGAAVDLTGLDVELGSNRLTGEIHRAPDAPIEGALELDAPDVATLAALALAEATGAVQASIGLGPADVGQGVTAQGRIEDFRFGGTAIAFASLDAEVEDAFGVPIANGSLDARDLVVAGFDISTLTARAEQQGDDSMRVSAESRLAIGTDIRAAGDLTRLPGGFSVTLETLGLQQEDVAAALQSPATVTLQDGAVTLTPLALDLGAGSVEAAGTVAEEIDLRVALREVPLAIANTVRPGLGLAGTVNGTANVTGSRDAPAVNFDVTAAEVAAAAARQAGLPPLGLRATGRTEAQRLQLDAALTSADGLRANATGAVPLGAGEIDLSVELAALPLALLDVAAGNLGLAGTVSGSATVVGTAAAPTARFEASAQGVTATVLQENAIGPIAASASGSFADNTLRLAQARATAPGGIGLQGSGTIPLAGPGLDVSVSGEVPLAAVDAVLADRGAQLSGSATVNATTRGSLASPQFDGSIGIAGGTFVDPPTNLRLEAVSGQAALQGQTLTIQSLSARSAPGGTISASGEIGLQPAEGLPADLTVNLDRFRYSDGSLVSTVVSGQVTLTGPVTGDGLIAGRIDVGQTEISIAEGFGATSGGQLLEDVIHVVPPRGVERTLSRAGLDGQPESAERGQAAAANGLRLDLLIRAPNEIFVRGRGLDAEVGGQVRLGGRTSDVQPVGEFNLIRGRITILTQRIDFDEGSVQLTGTLDPLLNFVARTENDDVTAIITVSGRASNPQITFSSSPELPQDEVLAQIIFNRSINDLSPFQIAQLAAAAAELAGGGNGGGPLAGLRGAAGLDELSIVTDEQGGAAVEAGKYLDENLYLDVQASADGTTRAQINLDITQELTARGSVSTDGDTSLGIFYERNY